MLIMPKVIVRKMIGLMRSLTALIKIPARNSLNVDPMFISWPSSFVLMGAFNKGCKANDGAKCPTRMAAVIAIRTQKVKLLNNFFIRQK